MRLLPLALLVSLAAPALADDVETTKIGKSVVTLHVLPSLDETELKTLRLVATNKQALAVFLPDGGKTFSAMAISPSEGFLRDGAPVASAVAIGGFPDAASAAQTVVETCDKARKKSSKACVVVLEVAPKG